MMTCHDKIELALMGIFDEGKKKMKIDFHGISGWYSPPGTTKIRMIVLHKVPVLFHDHVFIGRLTATYFIYILHERNVKMMFKTAGIIFDSNNMRKTCGKKDRGSVRPLSLSSGSEIRRRNNISRNAAAMDIL